MPKFKRGGVWYARIKVDGAWIARTLSTRDAKVADIRYRDAERRAADPAADEATFGDAVDAFVTSRIVKGSAAGTMHMYRVKLGHWLRLFGPDLPLARVDAPRVDRALATRLAEGASRNTIGKELTALRGLLKVAQRAGTFRRPLWEVLPAEWSTDYVPRKTALTARELKDLLAALPKRRRALVMFIVATGARWSEALAVTLAQIDLEKGLVHFPITKTARKGKREKWVPVTSLNRPLLKRALAGVPFEKWHNVRRDLALACEKAKVPRVTPNDLRRTHANWLREAGVDVSLIADVLGHTDSRMVERVYGRLRPEQLRDRILETVH